MSKDEFIDGYMARSRAAGSLTTAVRTPDGFRVGDLGRVAVPCDCGDETCEGWAMVADDPETVADYARFYGPRTEEVGLKKGSTFMSMEDREHAKEASLRVLRSLKERLEKRAFAELNAASNGEPGSIDQQHAIVRALAAKTVAEEVSGLLRDEEYPT